MMTASDSLVNTTTIMVTAMGMDTTDTVTTAITDMPTSPDRHFHTERSPTGTTTDTATTSARCAPSPGPSSRVMACTTSAMASPSVPPSQRAFRAAFPPLSLCFATSCLMNSVSMPGSRLSSLHKPILYPSLTQSLIVGQKQGLL